MTPTQSVIIPVRNGSNFIGEAIASALPQLAEADEIVVIDNGSTDDTVAVVRAIADPRVRLISETRPGPAAARNAGLAVARGDLVSFLDHDDYWLEGRNAGLLKALADDPAADAAYGRLRMRVEPGADDQGLAALDGTLAQSVTMLVFVFRRQPRFFRRPLLARQFGLLPCRFAKRCFQPQSPRITRSIGDLQRLDVAP